MSTGRTTRQEPPLYARLLIAWATNAILLGIVVVLLTDVTTRNAGSLIEAAAVFGVLNTIIKPVLRLVTLPLAILSLGIAWFFVSLLMLFLTDHIVSGFQIHGFTTYVGATLIIWVVNLIMDVTPGPWQLTGKRNRVRMRRQDRLR
jgi:putative membrane protein